MNESVAAVLASYDRSRLTLCSIGSHSALEVAYGARRAGLRNLIVTAKGREKTYDRYFARIDSNIARGCVDDTLELAAFPDILRDDVQHKLIAHNAVFVPNRSFEVYLREKYTYDEIEQGMRVPVFGNRSLLRAEERDETENQYALLQAAQIRHPVQFATPEKIDRLVIVKAPHAKVRFERAFFVCSSPAEYAEASQHLMREGMLDAKGLSQAVIEEYALGPSVNLNFFYSPLLNELELCGTDTRRQTNLEGLRNVAPAVLPMLANVPVRMEEAGHIAATLTESMLEKAFEMGERFVAAARAARTPGVIGPFALQCVIVAGPPKDFVCYDVSLRIPGSPGTRYTPYSAYRWGRDLSVGERVAMEVAIARDADRLAEDLNVNATPTVFVLDFGAQYSQLIARRVRELGVYCEIVPYDVPWRDLAARKPAALILSGGPESTLVPDAPDIDPAMLTAGTPLLGICYGMQLIARHLGAELVKLERAEYGPATLRVVDARSPLFEKIPGESRAWMSHGDSVVTLSPGFEKLASTQRCDVAAMGDSKRRIYGVQFHPEVVHTEHGRRVLENFLREISGITSRWKMESFAETAIAEVREQVGKDKVICALSGGVDSAVAATLVSRAVGEQLTCIFVDHGLLRKDEAPQVVTGFRDVLHLNVIAVDARKRFLDKLAGIEDPERKRIVIGHEFIAVFEEEAAKIPGVRYLVQGTLYPDVIESKTPESKAGHKIKSHHNVGGLPERMRLGLIEPLRRLFKDEVRAVGRVLKLPEAIVERQPFPGPGLAVRIIGDVTAERLDVVRDADAIVRAEIDAAPLDPKPWQYFAVLTPVKSVGVMGDERTYSNLVAIRAITSEDGMTADWARLPHALLERISTRIVNEVPGVNRVAYDVTSKPPATVEWE